jgi:hypothetical protein
VCKRQADEIIGGHRECELPIDFEHSAMPHLAQAGAVLVQPKASSTRLRAYADKRIAVRSQVRR